MYKVIVGSKRGNEHEAPGWGFPRELKEEILKSWTVLNLELKEVILLRVSSHLVTYSTNIY